MSPQELKRARLAMGLSQSGLAERLQTTRNTVARWERGEQTITHVTGLAIQYLLLMHKSPKGRKRK
jgi:DNA-binding transcriptional regulator YiaG